MSTSVERMWKFRQREAAHLNGDTSEPEPATPERLVVFCTPEERADIVRLYRDESWSMARISRYIGCSPGTVRRVLDGAHIPRRTDRARIPERAAYAVDLYRQGFSTTEVASQLGCDHTTVLHHLKRAGVPRRTPAEQVAVRDARFRRALADVRAVTTSPLPGRVRVTVELTDTQVKALTLLLEAIGQQLASEEHS